MSRMKYVIGILLLFMVIGFATVTVTLSINGNAKILSDLDQFKVYFSDVKLNNARDLTLVKSEKELQFYFSFTAIGTTQVISYDVTNASKIFDASLNISCTQGDEYFSVVNVFDTSTNLEALGTRTGTLTMKKIKSISSDSDKDYSVTCTIDATPIERDSEAGGSVISPVQPIQLYTGDVISIDGENFNVISQTDTTVTMLAQYNLGENYRQVATSHRGYYYSSIQSGELWEYTPGPKEIDIQTYSEYPKKYVNEYALYIQGITGSSDIQGDLITLQQLKKLGCTISEDYSYSAGFNCVDSVYSEWLVNGQAWWTRSAVSTSQNFIWVVGNTGTLSYSGYIVNVGQLPPASYRPIITLPIEIARYYSLKTYDIGEEVTISNEIFNVISDNGTTVSMLAKNNLGTNYRQTETSNLVKFSDNNGWEFSPGPKEIDIQTWSTNPKTYINNYVSYLKGETGDSTISGDLITVSQLGDLGCTVPSDYANGSGGWTCTGSEHIDWLGEGFWTKSAVSDGADGYGIWFIYQNNLSSIGSGYGVLKVRPVITISKKSL